MYAWLLHAVEDVLPVLEAEFQRMQLPGRHPRLLSSFNRIREACGKPPLKGSEVAPAAAAPAAVAAAAAAATAAGAAAAGATSLPFKGGLPHASLIRLKEERRRG